MRATLLCNVISPMFDDEYTCIGVSLLMRRLIVAGAFCNRCCLRNQFYYYRFRLLTDRDRNYVTYYVLSDLITFLHFYHRNFIEIRSGFNLRAVPLSFKFMFNYFYFGH